MPAITKQDATEKLATAVAQAKPSELAEIYGELFPTEPLPNAPSAADLAQYVRNDLAPEEIVDLWNVMFPDDHHVWYNEATGEIVFNQELAGYAD